MSLTRRDQSGHTAVMRRLVHHLTAARTALLTATSFASGIAAAWTWWGLGAGLAAACGFGLWGAHLSADDKGSTR